MRNQALMGFGVVRHTRLRPVLHAFAYKTYFLMLPMRSLEPHTLGRDANMPGLGELARNRFAPISFYDADHGDGRSNALHWLDELLLREGIDDACGEIWLHCYPRVFGYTFKPVSFWYCHRSDGSLRAVVVEVNNTFGEKHVYLLDHARMGQALVATKVLHVSPFCAVQGQYRFRFMTTADSSRTVARIDYEDGEGALLQTSVSGALQPLDAAAKRKAILSHGPMTLAIILRIHWQALRLWLKRVPFFSKSTPPAAFVTR